MSLRAFSFNRFCTVKNLKDLETFEEIDRTVVIFEVKGGLKNTPRNLITGFGERLTNTLEVAAYCFDWNNCLSQTEK
jgi:hypothetical protein